MDINEQLDKNAADLRDVQADSQLPRANAPITPANAARRSVSKTEIIIAVGILIGVLCIVFLLLQRGSSPQTYSNGSDKQTLPIYFPPKSR